MKRYLLLLTMGFLFARPAPAQMATSGSGTTTTEVFAGGSYFRAGISGGTNLAGWQTDIDYNVFKHVGIVVDFGGQYKSVDGTTLSLYEYMAGPRFMYRAGRTTAFFHGLLGGDASHVPGSTQGAFAAGVGGGIDVKVGKHVSIRLIQIDWIDDHTRDVWRQNFRGAVGVVFKLPHMY
jgi:hypothetical protein